MSSANSFSFLRPLLALGIAAGLSACAQNLQDLREATADPWVKAQDAFVVKDCAATLENVARAELNPDVNEFQISQMTLMRGICAEDEGALTDAVGYYNYVLVQHPKTPAAFVAGERLKNLSEQALLLSGG